jgi:hypothetical protein
MGFEGFPRFEFLPTAERLLGRQSLWTQIRWPQGRDGSTPFSGTILTYTDLTFFDFKFVMSQAVIPEGTHGNGLARRAEPGWCSHYFSQADRSHLKLLKKPKV